MAKLIAFLNMKHKDLLNSPNQRPLQTIYLNSNHKPLQMTRTTMLILLA